MWEAGGPFRKHVEVHSKATGVWKHSTNSENNRVTTIMVIISPGNLPDNRSVEAAAYLAESPTRNNERASSHGALLRLPFYISKSKELDSQLPESMNIQK